MLKPLSHINNQLYRAVITNSEVNEAVIRDILNAEVYLKSRISISYNYSEFRFLTLLVVYSYQNSSNSKLKSFSINALQFFFKEFTYYNFFFAYDSFYFQHFRADLQDFLSIIKDITHFNPAAICSLQNYKSIYCALVAQKQRTNV